MTKKQLRLLYPYSQEPILIIGAGREGYSTYEFLRQTFPRKVLSVADIKPSSSWSTPWQQAIQNDGKLRIFSGSTYLGQLHKFTIIFKSPGIPKAMPELQKVLSNNRILLTSNTELFLKLCPGKTIGITGTKGKSTTSSLIFHVLSQNNLKSVLVGNIGVPALSVLNQINTKTVVVMEMSSHQLEDMTVSPHLAIIQNITSEHLDHFPNVAAYRASKAPIVTYQKSSDYVIYNPNLFGASKLANLSQGKQLLFAVHDEPNLSAFVDKKTVFYRNLNTGLVESVINLKKMRLKGIHNLQNILPTAIVGKMFGLTGEQINNAAINFTPLKHRLEWVASVGGVDYYNDSLATMPDAAVAALKTFVRKPIVLLAGGSERHQDFSAFAQQILHQKVPVVILFPSTGTRLKEQIETLATQKKQLPPTFFSATSMLEAVTYAHQVAKTGSIVLLSPGAASFDLFLNYADRGNQFASAVQNLL